MAKKWTRRKFLGISLGSLLSSCIPEPIHNGSSGVDANANDASDTKKYPEVRSGDKCNYTGDGKPGSPYSRTGVEFSEEGKLPSMGGDTCENGKAKEAVCSPNERSYTITYDCVTECDKNYNCKPIPSSKTCVDLDGGKDPTTPSFVITPGSNTHIERTFDQCVTNMPKQFSDLGFTDAVRESYCLNGEVKKEFMVCPKNTVCTNEGQGAYCKLTK